MSNMSYCRFRNTLADLQDCLEAIRSGESDDASDDEREAAGEMREVCAEFVELFDANCC